MRPRISKHGRSDQHVTAGGDGNERKGTKARTARLSFAIHRDGQCQYIRYCEQYKILPDNLQVDIDAEHVRCPLPTLNEYASLAF